MKPQKVGAEQVIFAMKNLLDEKAAQRKWEDRDRIGFNSGLKRV
jgi:hypothetical protein